MNKNDVEVYEFVSRKDADQHVEQYFQIEENKNFVLLKINLIYFSSSSSVTSEIAPN